MAKQWKKKPVVIEAVEWTGFNHIEMKDFASGAIAVDVNKDPERLLVKTLEGTMIAEPGDYIIKGIKGEFYPCKPDIFEATYERHLVWDENI